MRTLKSNTSDCLRHHTLPKYDMTMTIGHFRRMFNLAAERNLDLDFHVDENRNVAAKGLRYVAQKALQHSFKGHIVCGHCWCAPCACDSLFVKARNAMAAGQKRRRWWLCLSGPLRRIVRC